MRDTVKLQEPPPGIADAQLALRERAEALERSLIGGVVQGAPMDDVVGMVNADAFVDAKNKTVWKAMVQLHQQRERVTKKAVFERLSGHEAFEDKFDLRYWIAGDELSVPLFIKRTAADLSNAHVRYALAQICKGVSSELTASEYESPTDKLLLDIRGAVDEMKTHSGFATANSLDVVGVLMDHVANPPPITKTGFRNYDIILAGGFMAGETYTLAGANKSGKSMMAGTISAALNRDGVRHGFLCLEMGQEQIMQRQVAAHMNFPTYYFLDDRMRTGHALGDKLIEYQGWVADYQNQVFVDCPLLRSSDAKAELYRMKADGCAGVIIDYFSLISPDPGYRGNQNEHQDILAQDLTKTAKDLGIWLLIIAQTNSEGTTYGSKGLLKASTHVAVLERVADEESAKQGMRWLRTINSRRSMNQDVGSDNNPAFRIHKHGSHIEDMTLYAADPINNFQSDFDL